MQKWEEEYGKEAKKEFPSLGRRGREANSRQKFNRTRKMKYS